MKSAQHIRETPQRRHAASALLAVTCLGTVLGPLVHSAGHRGDHTHGPLPLSAASLLPEDETPHSHGHGPAHVHTHATRANLPAPEDAPPPASPDTPFDHGDGSPAHFGVPLLEARATVLLIEHILVVTWAASLPPDAPAPQRFLMQPRQARGPPAMHFAG